MATVTVGRIVHYILNQADADAINRRRSAKPNWPEWPEGAIAHVGNTAQNGDTLPMIVCRVWGEAGVNGQVFLDGNDSLWVTSRHEGNDPGDWHWPVREEA